MLGAVIGDIVGSAYEFNNTRDLDFRMLTYKSNYTDDTVIAFAVAQWAMEDKTYSPENLVHTMVKFSEKYPYLFGEYGGGFNTWLFCPEHLTDYRDGRRLGFRLPYHSWGNGAAMRAVSLGWLFDNIDRTEQIAGISAAVSHNHPEGIKGAKAVAAAVYMARHNLGKSDIRYYISSVFGYDLDRTWEDVHKTYRWDSSCQGTVPEAIISFLDSSDYESAVRNAVSLGGDSDTLACITGAVAEAYYKDIPQYLVDYALHLLPGGLLDVLKGLYKTDYGKSASKYLRVSMNKEFTPEYITSLKENEVFVFGSNLDGQHYGGAARLAHNRFGAEWGVGVGMTGQCYAIPTMHGGVESIRPFVEDFIDFAAEHPEKKFLVTRIGCGIAGFHDADIAPLFQRALQLKNVVLPETFYRCISVR